MSDTDETDVPIEPLTLDAWHRRHGARMVPFAGYQMPLQYDGIIAEHLWTRSNAGLFDVSHMGQLLISGDGAAEALEALLPGDIIGLGIGRTRYSLLLGADGGILDDLMITRRADGFYVVVNGAVKHDDIAYLREHLPDEITINHMDDRALLAIQGPKAVDVVRRVLPGAEQLDQLYFLEAAQFDDIWISRSGYTGEDGFEISVDTAHVGALADAFAGQPEVKPVGLGARDSLRLEAGLPLYGHDLSPAIDPVEAQLAFAISKRRRLQGGFPGATRIRAQLADGARKTRIGFILEGRQPAREGSVIYVADTEIGHVTSGGFSPSLQVPIGMGYVATEYAGCGTAIEIAVRDKHLRATVTAMPFVPHRYHRKDTR